MTAPIELAAGCGTGRSICGLFAQSFAGTWQGGLKIPQAPNDELRIVLKIEAMENDKLGAEFYSIDQNPTHIQADYYEFSPCIRDCDVLEDFTHKAIHRTLKN